MSCQRVRFAGQNCIVMLCGNSVTTLQRFANNLKTVYFWIFAILVFSCDGRLIIQGRTVSQYKLSGMVSDSVTEKQTAFEPVENAVIRFYLLTEKKPLSEQMVPELTIESDTSGFFDTTVIIPPNREMWGILVTQKSGFKGDTINFSVKSSKEPYLFDIVLDNVNQ